MRYKKISKSTEKLFDKQYVYLEQIRDFTYKDVVLADTKAGFSITITAASVAGFAALFDRLSKAEVPWVTYMHILWVISLVSSGFSVLCAMLTILPRSYISHEMAMDSSHWVHMHTGWKSGLKRRALDAFFVLSENIWQRQNKGTPQSLDMLLKNTANQQVLNGVLLTAMKRATLVQNLKYLWVGKSILLSFNAMVLMAISFILGFYTQLPDTKAESVSQITTNDMALRMSPSIGLGLIKEVEKFPQNSSTPGTSKTP